MFQVSTALFVIVVTTLLCSCVNAELSASPAVEDAIEDDCLVIDGMNVLDDTFPADFPALAMLFRCATRAGPIVTFFAGNTSLETFETLCSDTALISIDEGEGVVNVTTFALPFVCIDIFCVFYFSMEQDVFISASVSLSDVDTVATTEGVVIPFLKTTVLYEFEEEMVETFAKSLAAGIEMAFTSPFTLRAIGFLASLETTCPFPEDICPCAENRS